MIERKPHFPAHFSEDRGDGFTHCHYCGSISIAEAMRLMTIPGTHFSGSDWKYGWPHKFYFDAINPEADKRVEVGRSYRPDINADTPGAVRTKDDLWYQPIMGNRPHLHLKFYNEHLVHQTVDQLVAFSVLSAKIFGITWSMGDKGLIWKSAGPIGARGYQTDGVIGANGKPEFSEFSPRPA